MSEIYIVNPHTNAFSNVSSDRLSTGSFADIWEMSYEDKDGENL